MRLEATDGGQYIYHLPIVLFFLPIVLNQAHMDLVSVPN